MHPTLPQPAAELTAAAVVLLSVAVEQQAAADVQMSEPFAEPAALPSCAGLWVGSWRRQRSSALATAATPEAFRHSGPTAHSAAGPSKANMQDTQVQATLARSVPGLVTLAATKPTETKACIYVRLSHLRVGTEHQIHCQDPA